MRKLLPLAAILSFAPTMLAAQATMPFLAAAQRDTTISVNITRNGRATADRVSLYLGAESIAETTPIAMQRLQVKMKAIMDSVKQASPTSVADVPILLGSGPNAQNGYPQATSPLYQARSAVRISVSKLTDLPALQLAAASAGAIMSGAPQYESSTIETTWKTKSAEALTAARAAAEASAEAMGYKLGRLLNMNVSGGPQNSGFQQPTQLNFDLRNSYSPIYVPEITINATVSASYLLLKK